MVYLQTSICLDQNQQKLTFEHGKNYNKKCPKSGIILIPDCIKSDLSSRPNPEGQINRKPEGGKLMRGPNK